MQWMTSHQMTSHYISSHCIKRYPAELPPDRDDQAEESFPFERPSEVSVSSHLESNSGGERGQETEVR
jgi:hypothetical protein